MSVLYPVQVWGCFCLLPPQGKGKLSPLSQVTQEDPKLVCSQLQTEIGGINLSRTEQPGAALCCPRMSPHLLLSPRPQPTLSNDEMPSPGSPLPQTLVLAETDQHSLETYGPSNLQTPCAVLPFSPCFTAHLQHPWLPQGTYIGPNRHSGFTLDAQCNNETLNKSTTKKQLKYFNIIKQKRTASSASFQKSD